MRFSKSWIINFGLIIIGIIFVFTFIEGGLRFYCVYSRGDSLRGLKTSPQKAASPLDKTLGWRLVPNAPSFQWKFWGCGVSERINSEGLHDVEHDYQKKENVFRIVILGDSFMDATQLPLEKSFSRMLEKKLNSIGESGYKFEVINMGVGGYSTVQEYLYFVKEGVKYEPDLVVLAFFPENDIYENLKPDFETGAGEIMLRPYVELINSGELTFRMPDETKIQEAEEESSIVQQIKPKRKIILTEVFLAQLVKGIRKNKKIDAGDVPWGVYRSISTEKKWEATKKILLKLKESVNKNGADFLVFSVPSASQVYEEHRKKIFKLRPGGDFDFDRPEQILGEFSNENSINFLSLIPYFREQLGERKGYVYHIQNDLHWSEKGHKLAAEVVADYLIKNNLVFLKK